MKRLTAVLALALLGTFAASAQVQTGMTDTGRPVYGVTNAQVLTAQTITTTSFSTTPAAILALPLVPAGTTVHGYCKLVWQQATAVATVSFGAGFSNAPTHAYIFSSINTAATGAAAKAYTALTAVGPTIIGAAATPGAAATNYEATFDFTVVAGTSPVLMTMYGLTSDGTDALVVQPGSNCGWQM